MICSNCGKETPDHERFCRNCGAEKNISCESPTPSASQVVPPSQPATQKPVQVSPAPVAPTSHASSEVKSTVNTAPARESKTISAPPVSPAPHAPAKKEPFVLRNIFSVFCCILVFIFTVSLLGTISLRYALSEKYAENLVDSIDMPTVLRTMRDDYNVNFSKDITEKELAKIYREGTFKDLTKKVVADYTEYIRTGDIPEGIDAHDVIALIDENQHLIYAVSGYSVTMQDREAILTFFENEDNAFVQFLSPSQKPSGDLSALQILSSLYIIIGLGIALLLSLILLFAIRKWRVSSFNWAGITGAVSAVLFLILGLIRPILMQFFQNADATVKELLSTMLSGLMLEFLKLGGITLGVSVLFILIYVISKKIKKAKAVR